MSLREVLKYVAAAPAVLGLSTAAPALLRAPRAAADSAWSAGVMTPGLPPVIISRGGQWGADESQRCGTPLYDNGIRAGIVHHTAGSNDYSPADSAGIVRGIYAYHTGALGWCDIAYNALVDKYGQVFEGRFGGITKPVEGSHTGGFNRNTWAVLMIGNFDAVEPTFEQVHFRGRAIRLAVGDEWRRPQGNRRPHLRRRTVHALPSGYDPRAGKHLRPPRCRQHRLSGQPRLCIAGPDPRHRVPIQQAGQLGRSGRRDAWRRHLPPLAVNGA